MLNMAILCISLAFGSLFSSSFCEVTTPVAFEHFLSQLSNNSLSLAATRQEPCMTSKELFEGINLQSHNATAVLSSEDSGIILKRLIAAPCYAHTQEAHVVGSKVDQKGRPGTGQVWGMGILFVTCISVCSLLGVSLMPLMSTSFYNQLLTMLIGLAVGSLSASSLFHLIPQAFNLMERDVHHKYLSICIYVWGGIWVFFMVERLLKIINDSREGQQSRGNALSTVSSVASPSQPNASLLLPHHQEDGQIDISILSPSTSHNCQEQVIKTSLSHPEKPHPSHNHSHSITFNQNKDSAIATVAWMIIFGDGLHNFIDGLSIGAAFNESIFTGISISLAVICEEFPHELGDFAVLLNAGMTLQQALLYNFLSACTCYIGLIVGIVLGEFAASTYVFGFAAGMFLYIALADMVPEMKEAAERAGKISWQKALQTLFLQNVGIMIGVAILYLLARYQDQIDVLFS